MNKRFRNYALWVAIFALIALLPDAFGTYDINLILPDNYGKLVEAILSILVLAGIINNPTTERKDWLDD